MEFLKVNKIKDTKRYDQLKLWRVLNVCKIWELHSHYELSKKKAKSGYYGSHLGTSYWIPKINACAVGLQRSASSAQ